MEDSMVGIFTWYAARGALNPKVVPWFIKLTRSARNAATRQRINFAFLAIPAQL